MSDSSHEFDDLTRVFEGLKFDAVLPMIATGQCCQMPWLKYEGFFSRIWKERLASVNRVARASSRAARGRVP